MNTWTSAAPLRCGRHGLLYAVCRECFPTAVEMACTSGEDDDRRSGAWLGLVLLAVVFALGLAVGWWLR